MTRIFFGSIFLLSITSAMAKQSLLCTINMTNDMGYNAGTQKLQLVFYTKQRVSIQHYSGYPEQIFGVHYNKQSVRIDGSNPAFTYAIWLPTNFYGKSGKISNVQIAEMTGGGTNAGKGSCISTTEKK